VVSRAEQLKRGVHLEYLTILWNLIEGGVAIGSGAAAGSIALVGFGVDSLIETSSGGVLLWRIQAERRGHDADALEKTASRLVGVCFLLLAAYVAADSIKTLLTHEKPQRTIVGMAVCVISIFVMPWLALSKRKLAKELNSSALAADSAQTSFCAYLSGIVLGGLALNALFQWWWADPIAALIMCPIIWKEGWKGLEGQRCADCQ